MSDVITYDIWIFTFVCLCTDNFLPQLVCLRRTILPAAFYNHCLPFECTYHSLLRYVICNYIWRMGSQNYELICHLFRISHSKDYIWLHLVGPYWLWMFFDMSCVINLWRMRSLYYDLESAAIYVGAAAAFSNKCEYINVELKSSFKSKSRFSRFWMGDFFFVPIERE